MSRAGYIDDYDSEPWEHIMWRGQVASATRGKRGQAFLRELVAALDAMEDKRLIAGDLVQAAPAFIPPEFATPPQFCALGVVGAKRKVQMDQLDPYDYDTLATIFGVAHQLIREIEWWNDEAIAILTQEERWIKMREWAVKQIKP